MGVGMAWQFSIDFEPAKLQPVLDAIGAGELVGVTEMLGGSSPAFRVHLADGGLLVLKCYAEGRALSPRREAYAAALLREFPIPVTQYLLVDDSLEKLPFRFALTTYLPGAPVAKFKHHPDIAGLYRQMGAALVSSTLWRCRATVQSTTMAWSIRCRAMWNSCAAR